MMKKTKKVVAVSGGFDPLHIGHVRMFEKARALGDELVVILNNDNWLKAKKGFAFMPEKERKEVIKALRMVDRVVLTSHAENATDMSVSKELLKIRPHIFANGGDRKLNNIPEVVVCGRINCDMVFNIGKGGKVQSSSWLLAKHFARLAPVAAGKAMGGKKKKK
jgi:cytidyltransferase-like protein